MTHALATLVCCFALATSSLAQESFALLRSGARVSITDVSPAGITIAPDHGRSARVESLSSVKDVTGPLSSKFAECREIATDLWRAVARLNRQDEGGAEPLFHQLWLRTAGVSGPTRAEIASGLVACRVHRGALATAIDPWAEWIRQSGSLSPDQLAEQRNRLGISDASGPWIETLPPIWTDSTAVRALASQQIASGSSPASHPTGDDVAIIYAVAARRDSGQAWRVDPVRALKDPAWANIAGEMVLAESEVPEVRAEARQRLTSRLGADVPLWKKTWIRLAIGRSFLLESGTDDRRNGVLNLLWIASRSDAPAPLVAIALVSATHGLVLLSDEDGARATLDDLERRFVGDVILDSPGLATLRRTFSQTAPPASQSTPSTQTDPPPAKE
ncbi:MAG: hypothetical protein KF805_10820 [Phycisphaeraceae bacterium]|nr:hypothetical protein [Phycisphaeraceae bacterium]